MIISGVVNTRDAAQVAKHIDRAIDDLGRDWYPVSITTEDVGSIGTRYSIEVQKKVGA